MCRFLAYLGAPTFLDRLLVLPEASLIAQSLAAREAKTVVNADGCGIGWYGERDEPGTYHGVLPAWSDRNLISLCRQLRSRMFAAHIRSATSGDVTAANCHPFVFGRHLFMHNGQIGGYDGIRRRVDALISDPLYAHRRGNGDSEAIFMAAVTRGLGDDPIAAITSTLGDILDVMHRAEVDKPLRFAAIHADGHSLRCYRWASDGRAPSLYWRREADGRIVASEPFDDSPRWMSVPNGSVLTLTADGTETVERLTIARPQPKARAA